MSASVDFTSAAAFRAYMETFADDLICELFQKFRTGEMITAHEGVKGKKVITQLILGTLVKRWAATFSATADAVDFAPRELEVSPAKVDLTIYPQEFEQTYLAYARRPGFSHTEMPFERYILDRIVGKVAAEIETAIWQGEKTGSGATDPLTSLFDGFLHLIADAVVATTLTEVATGALTATNAVASVEAMWDALDPAYKDEDVAVFMSYANFQNYARDYRTRYGFGVRLPGSDEMKIKLDFGNAYLVPVSGMGTSGRVVMTPANNLHYGYDMADDMSTVRIQELHRGLDLMMDFKIGAQIGLLEDGIIVVNDQT